MTRYLCFLGAAALLAGCSSKSIRMEYVLDRYGDLIVTNSPSFFERASSERGSDGLRFNFSFIARNVGKAEAKLQLDQAGLAHEGVSLPVACRHSNTAAQPNLVKAGESIQVDCPFTLIPDEQNKLATSDAALVLSIPYQSGGKTGSIQFKMISNRENFK
jgi:hypothetical protein